MADIQGHFCRKCGEKLKEIDKFCYKCGEKRPINDKDTTKEDVTTKVPLSLDAYKFFKKEERASHFKPKKTGSSSSSKTTQSKKHMVSINIGLMKYIDQSFKPVRGKKLPLKVHETIDYFSLKRAAVEKHANHDQLFCGLEEYSLLYPDGKEAYFLPGITSSVKFQLDLYKEELGKPYSQIVLYLICSSEVEAANENIAIEPKLSLPGVTKEALDDIFAEEIPINVDQEGNVCMPPQSSDQLYIQQELHFHNMQQLPSLPVDINLDDIINHEDNAITTPTSNIETPGSQDILQSQITNLPPTSSSLISSSQRISPQESVTTMSDKFENIRRNFVQPSLIFNDDIDNVFELQVRRRKIWEDTNVKLKRQLKQGLIPFRITFIGEPAFDAGGPTREFFTYVFNDASRYIMEGTTDSFTFLHDVKKLRNGDFERYGTLIALALIYGCPGPRNMQESLACALLDMPIVKGKIKDIPDLEIQTKLEELSNCTEEENFQYFLQNFPERFTMGVTAPVLHLSDKDTLIDNIVYHSCISLSLEEIREVQKGMSTLGVCIIFFCIYMYIYTNLC